MTDDVKSNGGPGSDPARARKGGSLRPIRVDQIVDLMASGRWLGARSHVELADEWGVSRATVQDYASAAGDVLRNLGKADAEQSRAEGRARLLRAFDAAMSRKGYRMSGDEYDNPDSKAAIAAQAELNKLDGLTAVTKVEHDVKPSASLLQSNGWTPAGLLAWLDSGGYDELRRVVAEEQPVKPALPEGRTE